MRVAIVAGTGIYDIPGLTLKSQTVETPYGPALVHLGQGAADHLVFLTRHGPEHYTPPHKINYRANAKALQMLGVEKILAAFAVGSINPDIPPAGLALLTDFLDFTTGRDLTFFDGGVSGLGHTEMSQPYCPALGRQLLKLAPDFDVTVYPRSTYVTTNGPRFETPAEIKMFAQLGGDVVGMTGVPEVTLARELGMHYAAVALSINWAAGIMPGAIEIVREGVGDVRAKLLALFIKTLESAESLDCACAEAVLMMHSPQDGVHPPQAS
jgi:5'-methylthioadenosine phosphorylase